MNCIFCTKPLEKISPTDGWHGDYACFDCHPDWNVRITVTPETNDIDYFHIYNNKFYVEQCQEINATRIFKWDNKKVKPSPSGNHWILFMTINDCPKISPSTLQHWLDRILNLKAFY